MSQKPSAPIQFEFQGLGRRAVVAAFDGGTISSEGGALLLRELDRRSLRPANSTTRRARAAIAQLTQEGTCRQGDAAAVGKHAGFGCGGRSLP